MGLTQSDPGNLAEIRQIHVSGKAVEGKLYYAYGEDGKIKTYRGTHQGRLKEETTIITTEKVVDDNTDDITFIKIDVENNEDRITDLETNKIDRCEAIALSIAL